MDGVQTIVDYADLLKIRQKGRQRDARLSGWIFVVAIVALALQGLLDAANLRAVYLVAGIAAAFGLIYCMAWVRLEITRSQIELVEVLQRALEERRG